MASGRVMIMGLKSLQYHQSNAQDVYAGHDKSYDCVYYNVNPPLDPLQMYPKTEIVYHACEWDQNYLSVEKTKELIDFLMEHDSGFVPTVFSFMREMV